MSLSNNRNRNQQRRNRPDQRAVRQYSSPSNRMPNFPPNYNATIIVRHTFRYAAAANGTSIITPLNVMNVITFYTGPTAASNFSLFSGYRVRKIKMWGFADSGTTSRLSLEFLVLTAGTVGAKPKVYSASSAGNSVPAKIFAKPPPSTSASDWQNSLSASSSTTGFSVALTYTTNTIIDLTLDLVLNNGDPVTSQPYLGTLTPVNQIYASNLDSTSTPTNLLPVGKSPFK